MKEHAIDNGHDFQCLPKFTPRIYKVNHNQTTVLEPSAGWYYNASEEDIDVRGPFSTRERAEEHAQEQE